MAHASRIALVLCLLATSGHGQIQQPGTGTIADSNSAAFADMVPATSGTSFSPAGRSIGFYCTTAGSLTVVMAQAGRSVVVPIPSGPSLQTLPLSVTSITVSGGAVCPNLWNLP